MTPERQRQGRRVIVSFMLRFVEEETPPDEPEDERRWRGLVKHIQSGTELHFSEIAEAESFIQKYLDGPGQ